MLLSIIVAYRNPTCNTVSPLRKLRIWCFYIGSTFCAWAKICFLKFIIETADINFYLSQEFVTAQDLYSSLWNQTNTPRYRSLSQWRAVRDPLPRFAMWKSWRTRSCQGSDIPAFGVRWTWSWRTSLELAPSPYLPEHLCGQPEHEPEDTREINCMGNPLLCGKANFIWMKEFTL